jgi:hypothetical protein
VALSQIKDRLCEHRLSARASLETAKSNAPLSNSRHEVFARAIAQGHRLASAYELAGFTGKSRRLSWELRHRPEVEARIAWLLESRVLGDTRAYRRREKRHGDLLDRAVRELEAIAFQDVREVADWRREPVLNPDGEVVDVRETLQIRDSKALTTDAAKAVRGVFLKGDRVRLELHDKRLALESLIKLLSGKNASPQASISVQQVNVGEMNSIDMAQRVLFMLNAAASQRAPAAEPIKTLNVGASDIKSELVNGGRERADD